MSRLFGEKINQLKRSYTEYLVEHAGTASLVSHSTCSRRQAWIQAKILVVDGVVFGSCSCVSLDILRYCSSFWILHMDCFSALILIGHSSGEQLQWLFLLSHSELLEGVVTAIDYCIKIYQHRCLWHRLLHNIKIYQYWCLWCRSLHTDIWTLMSMVQNIWILLL